MSSMTGRVIIGRYRLEERLGHGGHGDVYRATDTRLGNTVAVKVLRADLEDESSAELRKRFELEATRVAALTHPYTVRVFDYGQDATQPSVLFIVMELLIGRDLDSIIRNEGHQPQARVCQIMKMVCGPLVEAHTQGIIHRDIAPKNIFLCKVESDPNHEIVKLIDFGIAKHHGTNVTAAGTTLGTLEYMSPEQAQGHDLDARSDIYALGIMMCEMLTGRVPFNAKSEGGRPQVLMAHVLKARPYLSSLNPYAEVRSELEAVVRTCLDVHRNRRYESVSQLREALTRIEELLAAGDDSLETLKQQLPRIPVVEAENLYGVLQERLKQVADPAAHRDVLLRRGIVARDCLRNFPVAVESFERVLRYKPDDIEVRLELADTHERSRAWDELIAVLEDLIEQSESDDLRDDLQVRLAQVLYERKGNTRAAMRKLRQIILRNPGHTAAEEALGSLAYTGSFTAVSAENVAVDGDEPDKALELIRLLPRTPRRRCRRRRRVLCGRATDPSSREPRRVRGVPSARGDRRDHRTVGRPGEHSTAPRGPNGACRYPIGHLGIRGADLSRAPTGSGSGPALRRSRDRGRPRPAGALRTRWKGRVRRRRLAAARRSLRRRR